MDKQIFAAIEISDHEIRLIIGEFFNTRFNVIKSSRIPAFGLTYNQVTDQEAIIKAIRKAIDNANKTLDVRIERVILSIPSYKVTCLPLKVRKKIDSIDGVCTAQDIREAVQRAMATKIPDDLALIQAVPVKYTVNGMSTRRMPINERCENLVVDVDLLCANRKLAFDLVSCLEKADLEVMDIFLDIFAIAKEGAFLEQGVGQNIVILKLERSSTTLGLINEGRLKACEMYRFGLNKMIDSINDKFDLKNEINSKLLIQNTRLDLAKYSDNPVYVYAVNGVARTISEDDLAKCIQPDVKIWLDGIENLCNPILQQGQTTVIITGEGGELNGLDRLLQARLQVEVKNYCPDTLGVRNSAYTCCLGLFYAYKDQLPITNCQVNSVDIEAFEKAVSFNKKSNNDSEESITQKLRGILFETKK